MTFSTELYFCDLKIDALSLETTKCHAAATNSDIANDTPADAPSVAKDKGEAVAAAFIPLVGEEEGEELVVTKNDGKTELVEVLDGDVVGLSEIFRQLVWSELLIVPEGHKMHTALPGDIETPSLQGSQDDLLDAPAKLLAVPAGQRAQLVQPSLQVPAGQGGPQKEDPFGVREPRGQGKQDEENGNANVPSLHKVGRGQKPVPESLPPMQAKPLGQGVWVNERTPSSAPQIPLKQPGSQLIVQEGLCCTTQL